LELVPPSLLRAVENLLQRLQRRAVDRRVRDTLRGEWRFAGFPPPVRDRMPAAPGDQRRHALARNRGHRLVRAEKFYQSLEIPPGGVGAGMKLPDLLPIAAGREAQGEGAVPELGFGGKLLPRLLALLLLDR